MLTKLITGVGLAAAAVGLATAAPAQASGHHVVTNVTWSGANCIWIWDGMSGGQSRQCGGHASFEEYRTGGDIGLDPEMSGAAWISCAVFVDGYLVHSDATTRGSGHEVTCMTTL